MIIIEDAQSYELRQQEARLRGSKESTNRPAIREHPLDLLILEVLTENFWDLPLRTIIIPNMAVKRLNPANRAEREDMKKSILHRLSGLLRNGRLERVGRLYTTLPRTDEKHQAYLSRIDEMVRNLPEPRLSC